MCGTFCFFIEGECVFVYGGPREPLKFHCCIEDYIFQCIGNIFCVKFQISFWYSTQNILPIRLYIS